MSGEQYEVPLTVPWGATTVRYGNEFGSFVGFEVFPHHAVVSTGMGAFGRKRVIRPGPVDAYRKAERLLVFRFPEADIRLHTPSRVFDHVQSALRDAGFAVRHIDPPGHSHV